MKFEFTTENFSSLSPRRRWFIIGLMLVVGTALLDMLPGDLPLALGMLSVIGLLVGIVLTLVMLVNKVYEDVFRR